MSKKMTLVMAIFIIVSFLAVPVIAIGPPDHAGKSNVPDTSNGLYNKKGGVKGKSNIGHLYLYQKVEPTESGIDEWEVVPGGMWGKMKYILSGEEFQFVFNGHDLPLGQNYTLIYYPDPWPGKGLICLGNGTVNEYGEIHIMNSVNTGDLPIENDKNADPDETTYTWNSKTGAKIWLVLSSDVDCEAQEMVGWTQDAYLFEADLINFEDTDDE